MDLDHCIVYMLTQRLCHKMVAQYWLRERASQGHVYFIYINN